MANRYRLLITILSGLMIAFSAKAQTDSVAIPTLRPVTSSYSFELGSAHLADTYLTPLHYRGFHTALQYERTQAMGFNPEGWVMQWKLGATFDQTKNPAKNATMAAAEVRFAWAMMHRWRLSHGFTFAFGAQPDLAGGLLYLSRNGNNPASGKLAFTLDATGYLGWTGKIWRLPLTLRYQPSMPLTGVFFSPDYGQLYYQIYLGETSGLVHAAWPGNFFSLDNLLTADLHFGNTSLRIGYHNTIFSSKVNNLVTQNITHAIVIGITTEWISLRPSQSKIDARIISAY